MKKILLSIALVAVAAASAMAQMSVGAGYLDATQKWNIDDNTSNSGSTGFYAGVDYAYGLAQGLSVVPGVYYGYLSSNDSFVYGISNVDSKAHYIAIPVNFKYSVQVVDAVKAFAYAGPQFQFGISNKATASAIGVSSTTDLYDSDEGCFKRFDASIGAGIGVDIADMVRIKFGYNYGLVNVYENSDVTVKNNFWHVGAAFLF